MLAYDAAWEPAPLVLAGAAVALAFFYRAFFRLRRRGRRDHAGWSRAALFTAAVVIAILALASPLDSIAEEYLVSAHMLQHVLIGDLVPALLLVALQGPLLFFLLSARPMRGLARIEPVRSGVGFLLRPAVSIAVWATALAVWHVPAIYDAALTRPLLHDLEHATFMLGGLLVWAQLVDPARRRALQPGAQLLYAILLLAAGGALVNVLVFSWPLYPAYAAQPERLLGLSPLEDQHAAALAMLFEQLATVGTFIALTLRARLRAPLVLADDRHPVAL